MKKILIFLLILFSISAKSQNVHFYEGRIYLDSGYIHTYAFPLRDTMYYFGDSYTAGVGAFSTAYDFATISASKMTVIQKNSGHSAEVLENRTPLNPYSSAVTNAIVDTVSVPTYNSLARGAVIEFGTNDASYANTNYTTTNFVADYTTYLNHWENLAGWGGNMNKILLLGPGYEGTSVLKQDSITYGLPAAATQARFNSFDSCVQVVAAAFGCKYASMRTPWQAFANNSPALLQYSDSIHPSTQGHAFIADLVVNGFGYNITRTNQQFTSNGGLSEVDSFKIRILNPATSNAWDPLVADSAGNIRSGPGFFMTNNPITPQSFLGYTTQGIYSHFAAPDFIRITNSVNIATTTALGTVLQGGGLELQRVGTTDFIEGQNRTTGAAEPLALEALSGSGSGNYVSVGNSTDYNSSMLSVAGVFDVSGAAWLNSTSSSTGFRFLNGFIDNMAASSSLTFRVSGASNSGLVINSPGTITLPNTTTSSVIPLDTTNKKILVTDASGNVSPMNWQVPSGGGGFTNPMTTNGDMIYQTGGTYGRLAVANHAGMKLTSGTSGAIVWEDTTAAGGGGGSPGGSTNNVQVNSSSSFVGAANLNYDVSNLWTLIGSSPAIGTGTGAPAAGDAIVKVGNRLLWTPSAVTTATMSIGGTSGAIMQFDNYFTNTSSSAFDFYTAPATTGTITRALGISTNQVIYTGAANPTYGTPVGGDVFIPYGGRLVSGFSSTIWSSFSPNHAGIMELKDAYTSGAITFYPSGNGTTPVLGATLNTIGNLIVNSTGIDSAAFIQTGTPTSTNANAYLPPGTIMTTPKNGSLTHVNGHLWFTDQGTNYDLLAGGANIYNTNGTLTGNRTLTLGGNTLAFSGLVGPPSTYAAIVHSTALDSGTYQVPLAYGTYTPTLTNTTNITSSTVNQAATYTRIGNIVHVNIACIITPTTASTATVLTFTLPFTTSNGSPVNIGSAALDINSGGVGTYTSGIVSLASTTTATLSFNCTSLAGSSNVNIQFDYSL